MNLRPIGLQILLRFLKAPGPQEGEIYVGGTPTQAPQLAEVIALGSGRNARGRLIPFEVKAGDVCYVARYLGGVELKEGGETYCLVTEEGLLGIVE